MSDNSEFHTAQNSDASSSNESYSYEHGESSSSKDCSYDYDSTSSTPEMQPAFSHKKFQAVLQNERNIREAKISEDQVAFQLSQSLRKFVNDDNLRKKEEEKKKPNLCISCIALLYIIFLIIAWPIVEFVFYARLGQLCSGTPSANVDFGKWLLADAFIYIMPCMIVVPIIFCLCGCACIDCIFDCNNVDQCNSMAEEKTPKFCNIILYSIGFIVALVMAIFGVFSCIWVLGHCAVPIPAITITATVLRFIGVLFSVYQLIKMFLSKD